MTPQTLHTHSFTYQSCLSLSIAHKPFCPLMYPSGGAVKCPTGGAVKYPSSFLGQNKDCVRLRHHLLYKLAFRLRRPSIHPSSLSLCLLSNTPSPSFSSFYSQTPITFFPPHLYIFVFSSFRPFPCCFRTLFFNPVHLFHAS